jgi:hypothetical protein
LFPFPVRMDLEQSMHCSKQRQEPCMRHGDGITMLLFGRTQHLGRANHSFIDFYFTDVRDPRYSWAIMKARDERSKARRHLSAPKSGHRRPRAIPAGHASEGRWRWSIRAVLNQSMLLLGICIVPNPTNRRTQQASHDRRRWHTDLTRQDRVPGHVSAPSLRPAPYVAFHLGSIALKQ